MDGSQATYFDRWHFRFPVRKCRLTPIPRVSGFALCILVIHALGDVISPPVSQFVLEINKMVEAKNLRGMFP